MQAQGNARRRSVSGHIYVEQRKKGPVWYWKLRLPDGGEERKVIGPEWTGNGRPPTGYLTRRLAQAALDARLTDLRRGVGLPIRTGATFRDVAEDWYAHGKATQGWKASTQRDYRSALNAHLLPAFEDTPLRNLDAAAIERWRTERMSDPEKPLPIRTAVKLSAILHGIFARARKTQKLPANPMDDVERLRVRYVPEDYAFYTPEDVLALVRETEHPTPADDDPEVTGSAQDAAIFLTAAFTGLRLGELLALRVRDVDFPADAIRVMGSYDYAAGVGTTKGGRGRSVPMVPPVATALARRLQRDRFTGDDDPVFVSDTGGHVDGSALRRRYKAAQTRAKLRPIRFHDLRHTFGSLSITVGSTRDVQEWLGHADARTTARYVHYRKRSDEAKRLASAFTVESPAASEQEQAR